MTKFSEYSAVRPNPRSRNLLPRTADICVVLPWMDETAVAGESVPRYIRANWESSLERIVSILRAVIGTMTASPRLAQNLLSPVEVLMSSRLRTRR